MPSGGKVEIENIKNFPFCEILIFCSATCGQFSNQIFERWPSYKLIRQNVTGDLFFFFSLLAWYLSGILSRLRLLKTASRLSWGPENQLPSLSTNIPILPIGILDFCKQKLAAPPLGPMNHLTRYKLWPNFMIYKDSGIYCCGPPKALLQSNALLKLVSSNHVL